MSYVKEEFTLTTYEKLLVDAELSDITVIENYDFSGTRFKGLYCDGVIALNRNIETEIEKKCVLAEEIGHHYTALGNILDQTSVSNRKQELHGRIYAYDKLVGLMGIVDAYKNHCTSISESAEFLDVTEEFLSDALTHYKNKYGRCVTIDNYVIFFEPNIAILELI